MTLSDDLKDIQGQAGQTLAHEAAILRIEVALMKVREEIEMIKNDRFCYRRMVNILYSQMVKALGPESFNPDSEKITGRYRILNPSGKFSEFENITRHGAEVVWREMWGLDSI